ncbi:MAG: hypothetical protein EOO08_09935 [Chitinophagaceae bacterium]|nr:MAG: hypothetical protein EOO08_09935 [Chitinophagaceae bacterium]
MELACPSCGQRIDPQNINVTTDLAQCGNCGALHRLSDLVPGGPAAAPVRSEPPPGSGLEMSRELDGVRIHLPRQKAGCGTFFFAGFSLFWLSFVAVWTYFAAQGSSFFALFSVPFWLVGGGMLFAAINSLTESQTVTVSRHALVVEKKRLFFSKRKELDFRNIEAIRLEGARSNSFRVPTKGSFTSRAATSLLVPAIISGTGNIYFFEAADTAAQEWAVRYLATRLTEGTTRG